MNESESKRYHRIKELFLAALDQPAHQRMAFLKNACTNDRKMMSEIQALLVDHAKLPDTLEQPKKAFPHPQPKQIGPFKILNKIGEGGMGTVYLAERNKPRQLVALKIIKLGLDTQAVLARFEAEQEVVALMDHPCVAKMYQAGMTEDGQPYFAMEYVAGLPITKYCDEHRLNTSQRLKLFADVCNAVQHAHQKGIIHRDIKPSNVLVTEKDDKPIPKVIDFGVAKSISRPLTDQSLFTQHGQLVGTPDYMSPEQAGENPRDIDTRTDIFSLGVLLYELLVGALPFDRKMFHTAAISEIQRIIREVDPPKPSTKLSSMSKTSTDIARMRRTNLRSLTSVLRGDLDWIVKCLEKDRKLRYHTANDLAAEIERYFNNEPVSAGPPGMRYLARKFFRRHRTFVGVAMGSFVLLAFSFMSISLSFVKARDAERHASKEASRARIALAQAAAYNAVLAHVVGERDSESPNASNPQPNHYATKQARSSFRQYIKTLTVNMPDSSTPFTAARKICDPQLCVGNFHLGWHPMSLTGAGAMDASRYGVEKTILIALVDGVAKVSESVTNSKGDCVIQGDFLEAPLSDADSQNDNIFNVTSGRIGRIQTNRYSRLQEFVTMKDIAVLLLPTKESCGYAVSSDFEYLASSDIDIRMIAKELAEAGIEIRQIHIYKDGVIEVSLHDHFFSATCLPGETQIQTEASQD